MSTNNECVTIEPSHSTMVCVCLGVCVMWLRAGAPSSPASASPAAAAAAASGGSGAAAAAAGAWGTESGSPGDDQEMHSG